MLLLDMAIHTFDSARFIVDREPLGVYLPRVGAEGLLVSRRARPPRRSST